ncbi:MAG TPA: Arc family DNA-binding protein [Stellaceae bacterium]|nr:Arc family DNA-binding protein [Stellaceae bacterium]
MSSITIRKLDPTVKERLRVRAAEHGQSMEAEVRQILQTVLVAPRDELTGADLAARIRLRFAPFGRIDLELPSRKGLREPPKFD